MTGPGLRAVRRRLAPMYVAMFLQNVALWVPIEKLFMTSIGFDAATIGVMAAVYAVVVPILEIPSGILADRWSRRGVLLIANVALAVSVTIGGLSQNVPTYLVAALFLGVFFAMQSGTYDSIVYDTVLEETGNSDAFERTLGRMRAVESVALLAGAIAGGAIAEVAPQRLTYFLTVPFVIGSAIAVLVVKEPRLHRTEDPEPLRRQIATTYRAILQRGALRPVIALIVLTSLLTQAMLEFGPLWLVALTVPAIIYGPHWAGLTAALGLGGLAGARPALTRPTVLVALGVLLVGSCVVLTLTRSVAVVIVAQVVLVLLMVAASIPAMRRLHDAVPSTIRNGVTSGVSTLTWLTFLPFALVFGAIADGAGTYAAAWLMVGIAAVTAILLVPVLRNAPTTAPAAVDPAPVPSVAFSANSFLPDTDPEWPGHWATPPAAWHLPDTDVRTEVRRAIAGLPPTEREVVVLRDVHGKPATEVRETLGLAPEEERELLNRARGRIRAHVEQVVEGRREWTPT